MNNTRGFSAIEVLIASTIIVVALLAIANMAPTAYRTVDRSGEDTAAVTMAQQHIEALKNLPFTDPGLADNSPAGVTVPVTVTYDGVTYTYTRTTTIVDNTPMNGVKQVTVTVSTPTIGRQPVTLVTLIAQ